MGYPLQLSLRYMASKKGSFISIGTIFAILGVALGVGALATALSVTGGFKSEFRDKVLGVNAHVLVLKYSTDFREYRDVMAKVKDVPGVIGVAPFIINPMMVSHGDRTATGILLKGIDPQLMPSVLDLPKNLRQGSLEGLRLPGAHPPERPGASRPAPPPKSAPVAPAPTRPAAPSTLEPEERDDAGRNLALLRAIQATLDEEPSPAPKAEAKEEPDEDDETEERAAVPPPDAPRGAVEPQGGYASELPDEDVLPPDLARDPCDDPAQVATLPGVAVGATLGRNLNLSIGDCVQVTSPTIGFTYSRGNARPAVAKRFRVVAVFDAGFDQYDAKLIYTDLYEAQGFYDQGDTVTGVEMRVSNIDKARDIAAVIDKKLANGLYHTMDWSELNHGLFTALLIQQIAMGIVLSLIVVIAAFTVVATLIMVVLDKKKEIAVLKAMGATDQAILRTFLYQGGAIGLIGTALGLALGVAVCKGLLVYAFPLDPKVYFISRLPVDVRPGAFVITGVLAIVTSMVATAFPALYAARLRPADGLRAQ